MVLIDNPYFTGKSRCFFNFARAVKIHHNEDVIYCDQQQNHN